MAVSSLSRRLSVRLSHALLACLLLGPSLAFPWPPIFRTSDVAAEAQNVTEAQMQQLFAAAIPLTDRALSLVDGACTLSIERTDPPRLCIDAPRLAHGRRCAEPLSPGRASYEPIQLRASALLCTLNLTAPGRSASSAGSAGAAQRGSFSGGTRSRPGSAPVAVFTLTDSLGYLFKRWRELLNKASYCERTGRPLAIWLGRLPDSMLNARDELSASLPWYPRCAALNEPNNTMHIYKALGLLAVLRGSPDARRAARAPSGHGAFYMDADTWFAKGAEGPGAGSPEAYLSLAPRATIVGQPNRVGNPAIILNSGLMLMRDGAWLRAFLAAWWAMRCGDHDQTALWKLLFMCLNAESSGAFPFQPRPFTEYGTAEKHAARHLRDHMAALTASIGRTPWSGGRFAQTLRPDEPLELPHVLVLPLASIALPSPRGARLPAIRSDADAGAPTFVCHTKPQTNPKSRKRPGPESSEGRQCEYSIICEGARCLLGGAAAVGKGRRP
jgi:hypothetical protein